MTSLLRYLFPPVRTRAKLPLLPLAWSSDTGLHNQADWWTTFLLKGHGLARTDHDATRVLAKHRGKSLDKTIQAARRKRRRESNVRRAIKRFKRLW